MTDGPPPELEGLLDALEQARAELLAALDGAEPSADGPSAALRETLWRAGLLDDWYRLLIDQALAGRPLAASDASRADAPPAHLERTALLREWLRQTRGALLARARRLSPSDLDARFASPDGEHRTPRALLEELACQDLARATELRALIEETSA